MRRFVLVTLSFVLALLLVAQPAQAGIGWCKSDPVVLIDDEIADIVVSAPLDAPLRVTGPTEIVVALPDGVDASLVVSDLGFGRGEHVTFVHTRALRVTSDGIQLRIAVYVPATDDAMPVMVEFAPRLLGLLNPMVAYGTANDWVVLKTDF